MGLNRMLFKNSKKDDFILYLERTIETFKDDNIDSIGNAFRNCSSLTSIDLPNVTSIGSYAFDSCSSLTSIYLPKVTSIDSNAFYYCSSLTSIDVSNVTSIGSNAFDSCSSLTSIDLSNVTSIGRNAFAHCSSLTSIHFAAKNKETIEALSGFSSKFGATKATIYFDL